MTYLSPLNELDLEIRPKRSWYYVSGCPGMCFMYFVGTSLDFFYTIYHQLLYRFTHENIRFYTAQTPTNFLCEFHILIRSLEDLQELNTLFQQENIGLEPIQMKFYPSLKIPSFVSGFRLFLLSSFKEDFFYSHSEHDLKKLTRILIQSYLSFESNLNQTIRYRLTKARIENENEIESVLGVVLGVKEPCEVNLAREKALKAIQLLIPSAVLLAHSLMHHESSHGLYALTYFEMRKMRGGTFTFHELKRLRKELPRMLQNRVFHDYESSYFPKNEEAISHEILRLARELKHEDDIPQLTISFQDIKQSRIRFNIVLTYIVKAGNSLESQLERDLPNILNYIPKYQLDLGFLFKTYLKRGVVFDLEIDNDFFSHEDGTLNLIGARSYISKVLEEKIGPFRDFNGGLLLKQKLQLETIKERMALQGLGSHPLLEEFFHHLNPPSLQATLPIEIVMNLFYLLLNLVGKQLDRDSKYVFERQDDPHCQMLVIKTKEKDVLTFLQSQISSWNTGNKVQGVSEVTVDNVFYFCFFEMGCQNEKNTPSSLSKLLLSLPKIPHHVPLSAKKTFRLNFHFGLPLSLNPQIIGDFRAFLIYKALFEGLTRINGAGEVELAAARDVEISSCGTKYIFYLRDLAWSNGEKLTAFHFLLAWKKALSPQSGSRGDIFYPIVNAEKIKKGEMTPSELGVIAKNSETLVIYLNRPSSYFLELLSHPFCLSLNGDYPEPHIFNGPFICSSEKNAQKLRLIRNPFYWDAEHLAIDEIEISTLKEPTQVLKSFESDQLDFIGDPFSPLVLHNTQDERVHKQVHHKPVWRPFSIYCNTTRFPLNCREIRQAMSKCIDRSLISNALNLNSAPLTSPLPAPLSLLEKAQDLFHPEQAFTLFDETLHRLNLSRSHFPELTLMLGKSEYFKKIAEILYQQWNDILGISINVEFLEWNQFYGRFENGRYQLGAMFQTAYYSDPLFYLKILDDDSSLINHARWKNQTYHECLERSCSATDPAEYRTLLQQAEEILIQEMPVIPLFNQTYFYLLNEKIKNFNISKFGYIDLKEIKKE